MPEEDEELEKLRKQREEEIEQRADDAGDQRERQREQVKKMAAQYLTSEARERLNNLRVAKPEIASTVESQIARLGRAGQIDKMNDDQLIEILKEVQGSNEDTDIKFRR